MKKNLTLNEQLNNVTEIQSRGITDKDYIVRILREMDHTPALDFIEGSDWELLRSVLSWASVDAPEDDNSVTFSEYMCAVNTYCDQCSTVCFEGDEISDDVIQQSIIEARSACIKVFLMHFIPCANTNPLVKDYLRFNYKAYKEVLRDEFGVNVWECVPVTSKLLGLNKADDDIKILDITNYFELVRHRHWEPYKPVKTYVKEIITAYSLVDGIIMSPLGGIEDDTF